MNVTINRVASRPDGMFGVLLINGLPIGVTCERPWKDNRRSESCIPSGTYKAARVLSPKFGNTFRVDNVPGRSDILFHSGNTFADSHGCILVGESFAVWSDGSCSIASSRAALQEFLDFLKHVDGFDLLIKETF